MPRLHVGHLRPQREYRSPPLAGDKCVNFTGKDARKEDANRSLLLRRQAAKLDKSSGKAIKRLAKQLVYGREMPPTLASAAWYRKLREAVLDHVVRLAVDVPVDKLKTVTLLPNDSELTTLVGFDAHAWLRALRADLERAGADKARGWAFASVHGEYHQNSGLWRPHYHLVVAGQHMLDVIERLRAQRKYKSPAGPPRAGLKKHRPPVRVHTVNRDELRYALSYALQTWWPARDDYQLDDGTIGRTGKQRLPGLAHIEFLLWLHGQEFHRMYMLFGLEVGRKGLRPTRKACANQ